MSIASTTPFRLCRVTGTAAVGATPILAPLPSNTHGPASFRGVIGPSWPFDAGTPPLPGLGVLLAFGVAVGIVIGSDVAWEFPADTGGLSDLVDASASGSAMFSDETFIADPWVSSAELCAAADRDRSTEVLALSTADALAFSKELLILSMDVRPASTCAGGSRRGSLDRFSALSSLLSASSLTCSQSSGSSTSASRSAAARQFGHINMG